MLPQDDNDGEAAAAKEPTFTPPPKSASLWLAETIRLLRKCADRQLSLNLQLARWIYLSGCSGSGGGSSSSSSSNSFAHPFADVASLPLIANSHRQDMFNKPGQMVELQKLVGVVRNSSKKPIETPGEG